MKYYIATSLLRSSDHRLVREGLTKCGHEITYDWTLHGSVKLVSKRTLQEVAVREVTGVIEADFLIVLLPGGGGTHVELGLGLAANKKIFLHSEEKALFELGPQTNAFYHHPDLTCLTCPLSAVATSVHSFLVELSAAC